MKLNRALRKGLTFAAVLACLGAFMAYAQTGRWVRRESGNRGVIVFVHGITGDSQSTWTSGNAYWPEMLEHDPEFKGQDIYVYQYPSPRFDHSFSIDEIVDNMHSELTAARVIEHNDITFVSHSMGGVVTRAFILRYRNTVAPKIRLLYFLATPTTGSSYAKLAALLSSNPQLRDMFPIEPGTYLSHQLDDWQAARFKFKSYCAYENPTHGQVVVDKLSAIALCTEPAHAIDADHRTIAKPQDQRSMSYIVLQSAFVETEPPIAVPARHISSSHPVAPAAPLSTPPSKPQMASAAGSPTANPSPTPLAPPPGGYPINTSNREDTYSGLTLENNGIGYYAPNGDPNNPHPPIGTYRGNGMAVAVGPLPSGTQVIAGTDTAPGKVILPSDKETAEIAARDAGSKDSGQTCGLALTPALTAVLQEVSSFYVSKGGTAVSCRVVDLPPVLNGTASADNNTPVITLDRARGQSLVKIRPYVGVSGDRSQRLCPLGRVAGHSAQCPAE
jgi:pimeloyl-ACP methyl ester carboxylesterase